MMSAVGLVLALIDRSISEASILILLAVQFAAGYWILAAKPPGYWRYTGYWPRSGENTGGNWVLRESAGEQSK
jgi:hypothetical protein